MKNVCLTCLLFSATVHANAHIHAGSCRVADGQVLVDIDASLHLPDAPAHAVKSGLNLHLVYDFQLQPESHWWGKKTLASYAQRLAYNPVSRQYILENPDSLKRLSFASLNDALADIAHIHALPVLAADTLAAQGDYRINVRLRLDEGQLPVSLRLEALRNPDWHIQSDWFSCPLDR